MTKPEFSERALPYVRYDKLPQIDIAAVVENKRWGAALRAAQAVQAVRDDHTCTETEIPDLEQAPV